MSIFGWPGQLKTDVIKISIVVDPAPNMAYLNPEFTRSLVAHVPKDAIIVEAIRMVVEFLTTTEGSSGIR